MKFLRLLPLLPLIAVLVACGGKGSSAPAPTNFTVTPQDTQLYMTWDAQPGVEYWVFCAPGADTIDSHSPSSTHSGWLYYRGIFSSTSLAKYYVTGLTNGTKYACTVNGRIDSGPGGPDATPQAKTPGYAGANWQDGNTTALSGMTVRSVAAGLPTGLGLTSDQFVAVGSNGNLVVSSALATDATVSWGIPSPVASATLNAVSFYTPGNRFVAVGNGGAVVYASSTSSWTAATMPLPTGAVSSTGMSMNAVTSLGAPLIAVGGYGSVQGLVYSSIDNAGSWTQVSGISASTLNSVVYVPDTLPYWIAVGDGGVVLRSTDGASWPNTTPAGTSVNYRSAAMLPVTDSSNTITSYRVVVLADDGTVLESTNGTSWTSGTHLPVPVNGAFVAVYAAKGQFMAIDSAGNAYTSNQASNNWAWSSGVPAGLSSSPIVVMRYTPSFAAVSNGWMVFDAAGRQRIAR